RKPGRRRASSSRRPGPRQRSCCAASSSGSIERGNRRVFDVDLVPALQALLLVALASSAPWALGRACGHRFAWPLDGGLRLRDGERLFGAHKTWRGLLAGTAACSIAGALLGTGFLVGAAAGVLALTGDALS